VRIGIRKKIQQWYFERQRLQRRMRGVNRRALNRAGAIIRRRARQSIRFRKDPKATKVNRRGRKRKKVRSVAGDVPFSHVKPGIKRIFFAYEPSRESVIVGAAKFPSKILRSPGILESGGVTQFRSGRRMKRKRQAARPFMRPALANARADLPPLWRNVL